MVILLKGLQSGVHNLQVSAIQKGIYMLNLKEENMQSVQKFIIFQNEQE